MTEVPACRPFNLAVCQMEPQLTCVAENTAEVARLLEEAALAGAELVIFPECALSGYVYSSEEEATAGCVVADGPELASLIDVCRAHSTYAVVGLLELNCGRVYNSAAVLGPSGLLQMYRKSHLPVLGIDRYAAAGSTLEVVDLPFARIGVIICYDIRFPETARSLALDGADLIALPTNWPAGADSAPEFLTRARAWENRTFVAACNRVGVERGAEFIGRSQIVSPDGRIIQEAGRSEAVTLHASIDPNQSRRKALVFEPGVFELHPIGHRRPELYSRLTMPVVR